MIRALRSAILLTCFAGLWAWGIILLKNVQEEEDDDLHITVSHVTQFLEHSKALGKLTQSIHTYGACELFKDPTRAQGAQLGGKGAELAPRQK